MEKAGQDADKGGFTAFHWAFFLLTLIGFCLRSVPPSPRGHDEATEQQTGWLVECQCWIQTYLSTPETLREEQTWKRLKLLSIVKSLYWVSSVIHDVNALLEKKSGTSAAIEMNKISYRKWMPPSPHPVDCCAISATIGVSLVPISTWGFVLTN